MARPAVETGRPLRNFYGRRVGKSLKPSRKRLVVERLHSYLLPGLESDRPQKPQIIDLERCFEPGHPIWLEIGFGAGEHLARLAAKLPQVNFIGCEPYINGVASLLSKLEEAGLTNARIHPGDVRDFFDAAPDGVLDRAFLLYPDPWPKRRHHRRRFVTPEHLVPLARLMKPGSLLHLATDVPDYARQAVVEIARSPDFVWKVSRRADWLVPWIGWEPTRYEIKALREGREPIYLTIMRT